MFADFQKTLQEKLNRNKLVTDLSAYSIDEHLLTYVLESLSTKKNIGKIVWSPDPPENVSSTCSDLMQKIEEKLTSNNLDYEKFPSHFTHCLLSRHVYTIASSRAVNRC